MKVKDLIKTLKQFDQEANVKFTLSPVTRKKQKLPKFNIDVMTNIIGNSNCPEFLFTLEKTAFESITDLIETSKEDITVKIDNNGIYFYIGEDLVREIDRKNTTDMNKVPEEYLRMLLKNI